MARAKRTDRAEARRRYRAQLAAEGREDELEPTEDEEPARQAPAAGRPPQRRAAATPPPPPARPGIGSAFRAAFRPANFAEDIAAIPRLLRHRSVWLPALISVGTTIVLLVTGGRDVVSALIYQYFIVTPPIGAIFLSGFLAPRASYLTGAFAGLVGAVCLAILVAASAGGALGGTPSASPSPSAVASLAASPVASGSPAASGSPQASVPASPSPAASAGASAQPSPTPTGTGQPPTPDELRDTVALSFILSPLTGAFFGAAAAWYRRFLNLANPNRGARRPPPNRGKPVRRR